MRGASERKRARPTAAALRLGSALWLKELQKPSWEICTSAESSVTRNRWASARGRVRARVRAWWSARERARNVPHSQEARATQLILPSGDAQLRADVRGCQCAYFSYPERTPTRGYARLCPRVRGCKYAQFSQRQRIPPSGYAQLCADVIMPRILRSSGAHPAVMRGCARIRADVTAPSFLSHDGTHPEVTRASERMCTVVSMHAS